MGVVRDPSRSRSSCRERGNAKWLARPACAALAAALAGQAAEAQDFDGAAWIDRLDRITVTDTRIPTRVEDAPVTVSVRTDEQIADELATDIKDLVRFEPGISVTRQPARFGRPGYDRPGGQ